LEMQKLIKDMSLLLIISIVLGVSAQAVIPNGLSLRTKVTILGDDSTGVAVAAVAVNPNSEIESATNIVLEDAYAAYLSESTLFLDAREHDAFLKSHIKGARNLPAHAFMDSLDFLDALPLDTSIITYCDGEDCNASIDLAANLKMMGFTQVNFFFGGSLEWQEAGYPMESGD